MFCVNPAQLLPLTVGLPGIRPGSNSGHARRTLRTSSQSNSILCASSMDAVLQRAAKDGGGAVAVLVSQMPNNKRVPRMLPIMPKSPLWTTSYLSTESFLENNIRMGALGGLGGLGSLGGVRGFKSRRANKDWRAEEGSKGHSLGRIDGSASETSFDPQRILDRMTENQQGKDAATYKALVDALNQQKLSGEDARLAAASIHGYAAGLGSPGSNKPAWEKGLDKVWFFSKVLAFLLLAGTALFVYTGNVKFKFGQSIVKEIQPENLNLTFDDVMGCDEAKDELKELVEFLMNPDKFSALGGKLPKGCLLVGPPGTGKTLLAKAVAGEAGVPFFYASGSEFDELFVGQGAKRVRDLFKAAKERAPCVIFIDEIDSVGSTRSSSPQHPYANQTINQLLSEMDGFVSNEGVIVLAATNREEQLDKALLRPGRFDTKVMVIKPDLKGRREILNLYLSKIVHDASVDLEKLAKMTVNFSGADLENMVNTAAIRAAINNKTAVSMAEFEFSHDKHTLGVDWKSRIRPQKDLEITAYHEAGHALVCYFTKDAVPLHKVTIVSKGQSGGHTAFLQENDEYHQTKSQFLAQMDVSMGGRAAEEIIYGQNKITSGASADLSGATNYAELMTKKFGMSEKVGLRVIRQDDRMPSELSQALAETVDREIAASLAESYKRALAVLKAHPRELEAVAQALLKYETLDAKDVQAIVDGKPLNLERKKRISVTPPEVKPTGPVVPEGSPVPPVITH